MSPTERRKGGDTDRQNGDLISLNFLYKKVEYTLSFVSKGTVENDQTSVTEKIYS
jgi:hypothetical protein